MTPETIANALGRAQRKAGGGFMAACPCHDDDKSSLSIDEKDGKILIKCFAGCEQETVISTLKSRGLWPEQIKQPQPVKLQLVASYDYVSATGELLYQALRYNPKTFRQRRPDGNGGWVYSTSGIELVPYRLPELIASKWCIIVEGEKDADNLHKIGIPATTNVSGASNWRTSYNQHFAGKKVVVIPDNDDPGRKHALLVAQQLHGVADEVRIVELPDLPPKGDASDWLAAGGTKAELLDLIKAAPVWNPEQSEALQAVFDGEPIATPEPLPLLRQTPINEPFPLDMLPAVIQDAVRLAHETIQAPLDLCCQSFLAAVALVAQPFVDVLIDGRRFPVSDFFVAVAQSGERKSAVDKVAVGPIYERQHEDGQSFYSDQQSYDAARAAWENQRKAALRETDRQVIEAALAEAGTEPKRVQPFFLCSEPSFQGIERAYAEGRYSLGLFSDEGGRFLGGYAMRNENMTATITGLSKLWDGAPLDRMRGGDGLSVLYNRRFSVHLMLQPVLAGDLFGNNMMAGQGFLSRCLCCWPQSTIGGRLYKAVDLSNHPAMLAYNNAMKSILSRPMPLHEQPEMGLHTRSLTLAADAKQAWIQFHDHLEKLQRPGGELQPIVGFASKAAEHTARVAGVLTYFNNPNGTEIGMQELQAGIAIVQFYLGEALRLFHAAGDNPVLMLAQECFDYGMTKTGGIIGLRNLYQYGPNAVRSRSRAMEIMAVLETHHRAIKMDSGAKIAGHNNKDVWRLVPLEVS